MISLLFVQGVVTEIAVVVTATEITKVKMGAPPDEAKEGAIKIGALVERAAVIVTVREESRAGIVLLVQKIAKRVHVPNREFSLNTNLSRATNKFVLILKITKSLGLRLRDRYRRNPFLLGPSWSKR